MSTEIKFLSLIKPELTYEVAIRGETPGNNVFELRKQISKLGPLFPSEDILTSPFELADDIQGVSEAITRLEKSARQLIASTVVDKALLGRSKNLARHISFRLCRIECPSTSDLFETLNSAAQSFKNVSICLSSTRFDPMSSNPITNVDKGASEIVVSCNRGISSELNQLKFNGKTCARQFVTRAVEFASARNIEFDKLIAYGTEIFTDDALHWFRNVRNDITCWDDLSKRLISDFSTADFDYRFLSEIRARTQGEKENIVVYISIMQGMFSQLTNNLSNSEKLEILLHNIRPCYASVLCSVSKIESIDQLQSLCRNYENVQCRIAQFHEPPKISTQTLAPNFAYSHPSTSTNNFYNKPYANNFNFKPPTLNSNNFNKNIATSRPVSETSVQPVETVNVPKKFCPRCRVDTHNLRNCTAERKILCFRCGKPDVRFHECPDCNKSEQKN